MAAQLQLAGNEQAPRSQFQGVGSIIRMRLRGLGIAVVLLSLLFGCTVGPNYKRPQVNAPEGFRGERQVATNSFGDLPWRHVFPDETLQGLIDRALTNNFDLRIAASRVEQTRALAAETRAGFFPQLNYLASAGKGKNVAAGGGFSPTGITGGVISAGANASWEIDLWGRIRRLNEAARARYFASREARHDVLISLIAEVAQNYFQLLALDRELEVARHTVESYSASLKIFNQRLEGGVASKLETASAEGLRASAAATIPEIEHQIGLQENLLSVLLGRNPAPISRGHIPLNSQLPPLIPAGLPSALLERRPDIREAEQQLRAANAEVGVAKADFFPNLNLTGALGQVSPELSAFTSGGATAWAIGANLMGPIFQGGRLKAQYQAAKAVREQTALRYQAAVLNALQEVSNALITREKLGEALIQHDRAVETYREAEKISLERYRLGKSSYYEVLQQQQQLFPAETLLVQTQLNRLLAVGQFYRALGGGWDRAEGNNQREEMKKP